MTPDLFLSSFSSKNSSVFVGTVCPIEGHDLGWIITFDEHCADILLVSALCLYITAFQVVASHYDDRRPARFFCL